MGNDFYNIPIRVKATDKTPSFEYIPKEGIFNIVGVSLPEDAKTFYQPILTWVEGFVQSQNSKAYYMINVDLSHFSALSLMSLIKIFRKLEKLENVCINWYYEDEDNDLKEAGEELSTIIHIHFNLINKF